MNVCKEKYRKAKAVHNVLRTIAEKYGIDLDKLYETIVWPLNRKYEHAYEAFKVAISEPDKIFSRR